MALHCYATSISSSYRGDDNFTVFSFLHQRSWALWLMSECMLSSHNHIALLSCSHWRRWRDGRNIPTCWKLLEETKYFSVNLTRCDSALQMNLKRDKLFFFFFYTWTASKHSSQWFSCCGSTQRYAFSYLSVWNSRKWKYNCLCKIHSECNNW